MVGSQAKQYDENGGEYYAVWHLAHFGLARCPGEGCCCDVTIFKHLVMPKRSYKAPERKLSSLEHTYKPAWVSRVLELRRLASQARAKLDLAHRIETIVDCTLAKAWEERTLQTDHTADRTSPKLQRVTIFQITIGGLGKWQGDIYASICKLPGVSVGFHPHQLHFEEFAALRTLEMVSNVNIQLLVSKKPFRVDKEKIDVENEDDEDLFERRI